MKFAKLSITPILTAAISAGVVADNVEDIRFGDTEVSYDFQQTKSGSTILTLIAQVPETNDVLRGLKNSDQRRLSKRGLLIYQCKLLMLVTNDHAGNNGKAPALTSRSFSLFTGVDLPLRADQRIGIQINALPAINETSLFNASLAEVDTLERRWETLGKGVALNLQQFDLGLSDSGLFETSESVEINARFPIFQMARPVTEWRYHFKLAGFKQAIRYIDERCTPDGFRTLQKPDSE